MQEIGRSVIRLESVDSTNNYTANRARNNDLRHGAVILAVEQTAGKGQMGAVWQSNAGENCTFSVFLDNVNMSVESQFLLTKIVCLSLTDILAGYGLRPSVKWPNDIYVGDSKIAGVLIENIVQGKTIVKSIIGVGLNVNQLDFGNLPATSLRLEKNELLSIDEVLFAFIAAFNKRLARLNETELGSEYHNLLYWLNETRTFADDEGEFQGVINGVSQRGELLVDKGGEVRNYRLKSIRFIR